MGQAPIPAWKLAGIGSSRSRVRGERLSREKAQELAVVSSDAQKQVIVPTALVPPVFAVAYISAP